MHGLPQDWWQVPDLEMMTWEWPTGPPAWHVHAARWGLRRIGRKLVQTTP